MFFLPANSRAFHKLLEIFQKVAQKLLLLTKVVQKLLEKTKTFFGMMLKYLCKLYNKSKIPKHFWAILRRNQCCYVTLSSIKTKNVIS